MTEYKTHLSDDSYASYYCYCSSYTGVASLCRRFSLSLSPVSSFPSTMHFGLLYTFEMIVFSNENAFALGFYAHFV